MLKLIMLRKKLSDAQKREAEIRSAMSQWAKREDELAQQIEAAETEAEKAAVAAAVEELEDKQKTTKQALEDIKTEIENLIAEIDAAESAQDDAAEGESSARSARSGGAGHERRCREFQRTGHMRYDDPRSLLRSTLLTTSGGVIGPTGVSGINDAAGLTVSSFLDLITVTDCTGMAQYKVAYLNADATAAAGTEGTVPTQSEPTFGSVTITPAITNVIGYISKEIRKQSPLQYEEKVRQSFTRALRRKLNANAVAATLASTLNDSLALSAAAAASKGDVLFDANLLSKIILSYGGDEGVDGAAYLVLSKEDLKAFSAVRGTNEYLPVYSIIPDTENPNLGTIKDNAGLSCRYCLSKDVTALSTLTLSTTAAKTMFYGNPKYCEMGMWGAMELDVNEGYKFGEGLLSIMGDATTGQDVTTPHGFVVVTAKKAST